VLLRGETGTGKELLAQGIHNLSPRARGPFVAVNVAAIPESLVEAELFGTAPGAFTGADRKARIGKFEVANGGTLFLDEIGDLPLPLQAKLLRVLQEQEVEPLGSNQVKALNVRVIAATHIDLEAKVAAGQFRDDLYYRLNVLALRVPPLRERSSDIPAVVEHLLDDIANRSGQPPMELSPEALALLCAQPWRGNVRELGNLLERAQLVRRWPAAAGCAPAAAAGRAGALGRCAGLCVKRAKRCPADRGGAERRTAAATAGPDPRPGRAPRPAERTGRLQGQPPARRDGARHLPRQPLQQAAAAWPEPALSG